VQSALRKAHELGLINRGRHGQRNLTNVVRRGASIRPADWTCPGFLSAIPGKVASGPSAMTPFGGSLGEVPSNGTVD
jgi:hypothetical protein